MTKSLPIEHCYSCYMCKEIGWTHNGTGDCTKTFHCALSDVYFEGAITDPIPDFCKLEDLI